MRLFELDSTEPMATSIVAVTDQLKSDLDTGKIDPEQWDTDKLLSYFHKYNIILGKNDLYNMIKNDPLKKVIDNIQGNKVVFKGNKEEKPTTEPEKADKVVKDMAKNAMKKKK